MRKKVAAFFKHAKFAGSKRPADCEEQANFERPSWFDLHKFDTGVRAGREYFFSIFTAHLSGLVILVYNQSILETLISTGNSQTISSLFKRYFNTAVHVRKWYDGNVFDRQDSAFVSISQVSFCPSGIAGKKSFVSQFSRTYTDADYFHSNRSDRFTEE